MIKDKKGWGLVSELLVILIVIVLLMYSAVGLNKLGLLRHDTKTNYYDKPELVVSGKIVSYDQVEEKIIMAFSNYREKVNAETVTLGELIENGYLETIRNKNNEECIGYANYNENKYNVYLKCGKYITPGYGIN